MSLPFLDYLDHSAYCSWNDCDGIISLSGDALIPQSCYFPEEGIPQRNPDQFFDYRFELTLDAEYMLRELLGFLVAFRQKRKLTLFLLYFCDFLEITYSRDSGMLLECNFQIDFSDRVTVRYSSRMCGCVVCWDGKQESLHKISINAIDDLRQILSEIWDSIRELPIWITMAENDQTVKICRRFPSAESI